MFVRKCDTGCDRNKHLSENNYQTLNKNCILFSSHLTNHVALSLNTTQILR
jgi:hypothetical protein